MNTKERIKMKPCLSCQFSNYECLKCPYLEDESQQWENWIDALHLKVGNPSSYRNYEFDE